MNEKLKEIIKKIIKEELKREYPVVPPQNSEEEELMFKSGYQDAWRKYNKDKSIKELTDYVIYSNEYGMDINFIKGFLKALREIEKL